MTIDEALTLVRDLKIALAWVTGSIDCQHASWAIWGDDPDEPEELSQRLLDKLVDDFSADGRDIAIQSWEDRP